MRYLQEHGQKNMLLINLNKKKNLKKNDPNN
jgi:hypothetical protein